MKPASLTLDPMTVPEFRILLGKELEPCVGAAPTDTYYVYVLVDPRDETIFYVGKGCGSRWAHHATEARTGNVTNLRKFNRIKDLIANGITYNAFYVRKGMIEESALDYERKIIKLIGKDRLTNAQACLPAIDRQKARARHLLNDVLSKWGVVSDDDILVMIKCLPPLGLQCLLNLIEMAEVGSPQSITIYQDGSFEYGY